MTNHDGMNPSLQKLFDELEAQREKTLQSVRHLTDDQLNNPLVPGKWSVAEILSHLVSAERMSTSYVQKKIQGIHEAADSGWWEEIKLNALKISQRIPGLRYKAPKRVVENTTFYRDFATIQKEWDGVRSDLHKLVSSLSADQARKLIYRHPVAGYLNMKQCLLFFREHIIHHTPQIKRLINLK